MASIFKTSPWNVEQLVSAVEKGTIQLPDLQRPFVWPATRVRDLLDSMYRGYPVGTLLFWDVALTGDSRTIGSDDVGAAHQIVDGQQRLTSLFAVMRGAPVRDAKYRQQRIVISFDPFAERFEVRSAATTRSSRWISDISEYFAAPRQYMRKFLRDYLKANEDADEDEVQDKLDEIDLRLNDLNRYTFSVVHIQSDVSKELVADIFVRINSEGVRLKSADYILTWLSVFWPEGREQIEDFARLSRMTPERASELAGSRVTWTPQNPFIEITTGYLVRVLVGIGQQRGRLENAYKALQAREKSTGRVSSSRQEAELNKLRVALPVILNPLNWDEFVECMAAAGYRSRSNITSDMNITATYIVWLIGRTHAKVPLEQLRSLTASWLMFSQLTYRYTGSSETQIEADVGKFFALPAGDAAGFVAAVSHAINTELTDDFWNVRLPDMLVSSSPAMSPTYQTYIAALNLLDADAFMSDLKVRDLTDPARTRVKGLELHHLYPRAYQQKVLGHTDDKQINQTANYAPTDWDSNGRISDQAPADYWPHLLEKARSRGDEWLKKQMYWHAMPRGWEKMEYAEFLDARRHLIAHVIRDAFRRLSAGHVSPAVHHQLVSEQTEELQEQSVVSFVEAGHLKPGDELSAGGDIDVDAVVGEDADLVLNGDEHFETFDEAARYLDVTHIDGLDFWSLRTDVGPIPLRSFVTPASN
ncbi:GmrSD restriction endonuclease domain-containing protein [Brevibacterium gallinarum]|uniref:DUF262 domain-containing protein n=1 Tax=Brevibacterium gallinarum TaxID=2762220 RepID=A0ABR8WZ69_9MICO|nr:DUF262 domain-containing protein [Brevibacterium gallinarum]MBD8021891.1 DUF262 domain-containing protein [Brevibacterium gallinarum]